jgi:hypothetical protein
VEGARCQRSAFGPGGPFAGAGGCAWRDLWREKGDIMIWRDQEDDAGQDGPSVGAGDDARWGWLIRGSVAGGLVGMGRG